MELGKVRCHKNGIVTVWKAMSFKMQIRQNSRLIVQLHQRVHHTFKHRDDNEQSKAAWQDACDAFRDQYSELAFLGGTFGMRERMRSGDKEAIEYALDGCSLAEAQKHGRFDA